MDDVRIAACQFAPKSLDKKANLKAIAALAAEAAANGAGIVCFHEQCVVGYRMWEEPGDAPGLPPVEPGRITPSWSELGVNPVPHAERIPDGPTTRELIRIARRHGIVIGAGLPELSDDDCAYNTYVLVGPRGHLGAYRKVHLVPGPEHRYFKAGAAFPVFDLGPVRAGVLICYDNHFPEGHRILAAKGAQLLIMPHVTVSRSWWPGGPSAEAFRQAQEWILTWARARAFDNSAYAVFVNEASEDGQGHQGCSLILDPDGHVMAAAQTPRREIVYADLDARRMQRIRHRAHDYLKHRRPELYAEICDPRLTCTPHAQETRP